MHSNTCTRWWAAIIALASLLLAACDPGKAGRVTITDRIGVATLDVSGWVQVNARCGNGEMLIGGGHSYGAPDLNFVSPLVVEESYPLNDTTWRVTASRSDSFSPDHDGIPLVVAHAYCISAKGGPVSTQRIAGSTIDTTRDEFGAFDIAEGAVSCPQDMFLTSGGFRVIPTEDELPADPGRWNGWIWSSMPVAGEQRWRVTLRRLTSGFSPPQLQVFAICTGEPLESARREDGEAVKQDPVNFTDFIHGITSCAPDELVTGGGFAFNGNPTIPHFLYMTRAEDQQRSWTISGITGHEQGLPAALNTRAICVDVPIFASVRITSPIDVCLDCVTLIERPVVVDEDPANPGLSFPIDFAAQASGGDGEALTGEALVWTANDQPLGVGAVFSATLPAPAAGNGQAAYAIEVVATDEEGNFATDTTIVTVVAATP